MYIEKLYIFYHNFSLLVLDQIKKLALKIYSKKTHIHLTKVTKGKKRKMVCIVNICCYITRLLFYSIFKNC